MGFFLDIYLRVFFVLTPFFVLSVFLSLTREKDEVSLRRLALKVAGAVTVIVFVLFFFGRYIFAVFGVTLDAFKIGAGVLLFLSAISLVYGRMGTDPSTDAGDDIAVVPLAMPIMVGPATTGVLLVMGAELTSAQKLVASFAVLSAVLTVCALLLLATPIERRLGAVGLSILSKLTGLMLASIAAQLILTGARHFLQ